MRIILIQTILQHVTKINKQKTIIIWINDIKSTPYNITKVSQQKRKSSFSNKCMKLGTAFY